MVEFLLQGGGSVLVEVTDDDQGGNLRVGRGGVPEAAGTFEQAVGTIRPVADALLGQLSGLVSAPEEVEVNLGFKLTGEGKLVLIASLKGEASCSVKLKWKRQTPAPGGSD